MLRPLVLPDYEALSRHAADWLFSRLRERPNSLLCLAAGSTPVRTYQLLVERATAEPALFGRCRVLTLDEWGGLAPNDPATCDAQLRLTLVEPLKLSERYVAFKSRPQDPQAECERIDEWLRSNGPIDICVLGLGLNGHVGFNEPADFLTPHPHVAALSGTSLSHPMIGRSLQQPTFGLTLGMTDLLQSRQVLLMVSGTAKCPALRQLIGGRISTAFLASFLHLHVNAVLLCDAAACG